MRVVIEDRNGETYVITDDLFCVGCIETVAILSANGDHTCYSFDVYLSSDRSNAIPIRFATFELAKAARQKVMDALNSEE